MTIENATPSTKLDQADVLSIVGGLLDHLVEAVAQRVMAKLTADEDNPLLDSHLDKWAMNSLVLEDKIGDKIQSFVDNQLDLDDAVRQALDNIDLDDMVMEAVQNLEFNVRVSR